MGSSNSALIAVARSINQRSVWGTGSSGIPHRRIGMSSFLSPQTEMAPHVDRQPRHDDADAKRDIDGSQHTGNPEALHTTAIVGQVPVTKRRAKVVWRVVPRSATRHAPGTIARCSHAPVAGISRVRFVPAILCPVPYVAMDIVDAPSIRPKAVHPHRR